MVDNKKDNNKKDNNKKDNKKKIKFEDDEMEEVKQHI